MSSGNGTGNTGHVVAVRGAVVDVEFNPDHLPEILEYVQSIYFYGMLIEVEFE